MEPLQKLSRRQVDTLRAISVRQSPERGASLNEVAEVLHVSAPSALGHVTVLEAMGLVDRHRGKSRLSARGTDTLLEYQRHHRIAESLFAQLGLTAEEGCRAAHEVDLAISHRTIERLCRAEQHPNVCPHGEPIAPCSTRTVGGGS